MKHQPSDNSLTSNYDAKGSSDPSYVHFKVVEYYRIVEPTLVFQTIIMTPIEPSQGSP